MTNNQALIKRTDTNGNGLAPHMAPLQKPTAPQPAVQPLTEERVNELLAGRDFRGWLRAARVARKDRGGQCAHEIAAVVGGRPFRARGGVQYAVADHQRPARAANATAPSAVPSAIITVNTTDDELNIGGLCSLRESALSSRG